MGRESYRLDLAQTVFAILMVSGLAEVILCLWLLLAGVNEQRWNAARATLHGGPGVPYCPRPPRATILIPRPSLRR